MKPVILDPDNAGGRKQMKHLTVLAAVAAFKICGFAQEADENGWRLNAYGSFDVASGYVLYGALMNDEPCFWTYAEVESAYKDLGSFGISLWQNSDMTCRRKTSMRRMNEWDWSAFVRSGYEIADGWRMNGEAGHVWYKYHSLTREVRKIYATMEEIYMRAELANPFLSPYFTFHYDHKVCDGAFFEGGVKREFALPMGFSLSPDVTVGGGSRKYLAVMYPPFDGSAGSGISYAQIALTISYWINDHFGIHVKAAFATLVDCDVRSAVRSDGGTYENEFVWGTIGVDWSF